MNENNPDNARLFRTPNPEELKRAAKEDPIPEREGAHEAADVIDQNLDREAFDQSDDEEVTNPIVKANISGH